MTVKDRGENCVELKVDTVLLPYTENNRMLVVGARLLFVCLQILFTFYMKYSDTSFRV